MPSRHKAIARKSDGTINCKHCKKAVSDVTWRAHMREERKKALALPRDTNEDDDFEAVAGDLDDLEEGYVIQQPRYHCMCSLAAP
jgi:hypothetical protein